jgi:hypothetical protein
MENLNNTDKTSENAEKELRISDVSGSFSIEPLFNDGFSDKKIMSKIKWFEEKIKEKYKSGFKPISKNWSYECRLIDKNVFLYDYFNDTLFIKGRSLGGLIYDNGKWSEPC